MSRYKPKNKSDLDQFFEDKNPNLEAVWKVISEIIDRLRSLESKGEIDGK